MENHQDKLALIDAAHDHGVVLLQFPGHIMLYLGRDRSQVPMVIHSFSEFLTPCDGGKIVDPPQETINRVDKIAITDLLVGASSSRTDFLSRVTTITVLGRPPDARLRGAAQLRPAAPPTVPAVCEDTERYAIFQSPAKPNARQRLRVISTSSVDPAPATLALYDPDGNLVDTQPRHLDGPPFSMWTDVDRPTPGRWTAVVGDGEMTSSCEHFTVFRHPAKVEARDVPAPVWIPKWRWENDTENLFSAFVEQLFSDAEGQPETWPDLQSLTRDPARNLLYDHHHPGEDAAIKMQPDCADLPYFLRGYFAYKLGLPFAYHECTRGGRNRAPTCTEEMKDNLQIVDVKNATNAFQVLLHSIANTVHSASARTLPNAPNSDLYPVPLSQPYLRPGTVFADPYGHLLVIARWKPQGTSAYGVLVGADAQPDGTVGRRRFWRGSFLFDPDTSVVGPGFKAWRPLRFSRQEATIESRTNKALKRPSASLPWSKEQYAHNADAFYDRMNYLINPRALRAEAVLQTLIDALAETVDRRLVSVDNGEAYVSQNLDRMVTMPEGYHIFETIGPWEDYATPSRDMRLLISIDAVMRFPDYVGRKPTRFAIDPKNATTRANELTEQLQSTLKKRPVTYKRSDGQEQRLSLADVVDRQKALEVAYNPNDCVEIRWGAPNASQERASCKRRAPAAQQQRMLKYRPWFAERKRPPR